MVERIVEGIYRIGIPLPNNPLKELNSYLIQGEDGDFLIDTGFRCQECSEALAAGLKELNTSVDRINVLITHLHSDHSGLAAQFAGTCRKIYMGETDFLILENELFGNGAKLRYQRFQDEGFPSELMDYAIHANPSVQMALDCVDERFCTVKNHEQIHIGAYTLEALFMPGHTPGHMMFWIEEEKIMFTGDHVLFDISPNITAWNGVEDSLGNYLSSLQQAQRYPVELALPGHRQRGDYHPRIDALAAHHDRRLGEVIQAVTKTPGITGYEIAGQMKWKIRARDWEDFPPVQKYFAVGECLAHLDYLVKRERLFRKKEWGIWHYYLEEPYKPHKVIGAYEK